MAVLQWKLSECLLASCPPALWTTWTGRCDPLLLAFVLILQFRNHCRIRKRRGVAERLALSNVTQQSPHDFPRARFREIRRKNDVVGFGDGADLLGDVLLQFLRETFGCRHAKLDGDKRGQRLALDLVRTADHRSLGDLWMIDERALDLHRADPMAGNVQHIVYPAQQPVIALVILLGA